MGGAWNGQESLEAIEVVLIHGVPSHSTQGLDDDLHHHRLHQLLPDHRHNRLLQIQEMVRSLQFGDGMFWLLGATVV